MKELKGRKKRKEFFIAILLLIFGLFLYRIKVVNTRYPQAKTVMKEVGEKGMIGKNIQFSVLSSEWMNREEMIEKYGEALDFYDKYDYLGLLVHVNIKNVGKKKEKIELYQWYLESDTYYCNGLDMEMFLEDNENIPLSITLKKGEEKNITLPYSISSVLFLEKQWKKFKDDKFYIVSERYPVKTYWSVNET